MPKFIALQKLILDSVCPYMDLNSSSDSDPPGTSCQAHGKNMATDVIKQPVIPALRQRQEEGEFKAILSYTASSK